MDLSQQLLTVLLLGPTERSDVPAAHTQNGRNNYNPEEPEGKLAVHRRPAKTSGPQEVSKERQGQLPKTKVWSSNEESKPQRRTSKHQVERSIGHRAGCADGATSSSFPRAGLQLRNPSALTWDLHCEAAF